MQHPVSIKFNISKSIILIFPYAQALNFELIKVSLLRCNLRHCEDWTHFIDLVVEINLLTCILGTKPQEGKGEPNGNEINEEGHLILWEIQEIA